ncbi:hypothetical protein CEUSTIGMA_g3320.t1 [Chlamydomonas eustigma]|uniref:IST1-like protein n=1 Tax=Chlamydomonas eustigma TaxID=1157962 RepID=A0A250WYF6_9CHLO|nr:hypothetical protein CEUSTIGMA_g3320.t1 [Chlamydomonas eustigma]|eukprot:GAX75877.1 hypothetical protein CEUSTIGMA_g3320.t1 [Chlamydomonas eustigma]
MLSGFKVEKCEIQCRLAQGRIKLQRNKRQLQLRANRKEVAELLGGGKQDSARIRVEGVIREELILQAYEILELYLELITVRAQLISKTKEIPRDMVEAISSVVYAAERIGGDLQEMQALRKMFESKYGKEYIKEATSDATCNKWQVNQNLISCLLVEAPAPEKKLATLSEIAQEYRVEWDSSRAEREMLPPKPVISYTPPASPSLASGPAPPQANWNNPQPIQNYASNAAPANHYAAPQGPPVPYTNAAQAAAAAAHAAMLAKAAAEYAAQFAMFQTGVAAPGAAGPSVQLPRSPLTVNTLPGGQMLPHPVPAPGSAPAVHAAGQVERKPGPNGQHLVSQQQGLCHSDSAIQRAYDAAQGPPSKILPPSAPDASVADHNVISYIPLPSAPAPGSSDPHQNAAGYTPPPYVPVEAPAMPPHTQLGADNHHASEADQARPLPLPPATSSLPVPPQGVAPAFTLPPPPTSRSLLPPATEPEDEYEALTKRLNALKNG